MHRANRTALAASIAAAFVLFSQGALAQQAAPAAHAAPAATAAPANVQAPTLSVTQIVDKHLAARGGVAAWKAVHGLQLTGRLEAGRGSMDDVAAKFAHEGGQSSAKEAGLTSSLQAAAETRPQVLLPFVLDFERPNRTRLEIQFQGKTAVQVFDGNQGWKLRPFLNRGGVEPFTAEETRAEMHRAEPEGLLVDYAAKGSKIALEGVDLVDKVPAYRIEVKEKSGRVRHVWIDSTTFLDVKVDGEPRQMDGKPHAVYVVQRDFRQVGGVSVPFVLETQVDGYTDSHRMLVEKALVNPSLDAATFAKPKPGA